LLSQLQDQVVDLQHSVKNQKKNPSDGQRVGEKMSGIEDEKVTEKSNVMNDNNTALTVDVTEDIPRGLDEFLKNKLKTKNSDDLDDRDAELVASKLNAGIRGNGDDDYDNENDNEWTINDASMRLSAEESLQLETELHHEMSHERRMSRVQDVTLVKFAQSLQEKEPVIWEGGKESESDGELDSTSPKENTIQVHETDLPTIENEKKNKDSPTPVITDQGSDSELSQLSDADHTKPKNHKKNEMKELNVECDNEKGKDKEKSKIHKKEKKKKKEKRKTKKRSND